MKRRRPDRRKHPTLFLVEVDPPPAAPAPASGKGVKTRGFTCPECVGARLFVYKTIRPSAGRIRRYRLCTACGYRETGEERRGRILPRAEPAGSSSAPAA